MITISIFSIAMYKYCVGKCDHAIKIINIINSGTAGSQGINKYKKLIYHLTIMRYTDSAQSDINIILQLSRTVINSKSNNYLFL